MKRVWRRSLSAWLLMPSLLLVAHCRHADSMSGTLADEVAPGSSTNGGSGKIASFVHKIDRRMGHGDRVSVPIDPKRKIAQITPFYNGDYRIPVLNGDGSTMKNDEGATYYKDGMYAHGFLRDANGAWHEVSFPKFVDSYEHDNWHDLHATSGDQLDIEFKLDERYVNDPQVVAAKPTVELIEVKIVYADDPKETFHAETYNPDSEKYAEVPIKIAMAGLQLGQDKMHKISFDASGKKVYKVAVRWGDAKPRNPDGTWNAGQAYGFLSINGQQIGPERNVAYIETQVWDGLDYSGLLEIGVTLGLDVGQLHFVRIYYTQ